ncbi:MAG: S-layer homology domain-containing protein [Candidatus Peribacteria bacterium]|jgi:hypothetical protein|nr:S-layer homology domain-containing protein [Candidatus Peribacteria bacterium]
MYENGLTMYNTTASYRPKDLVTREESAKLVGQLYETLQFEQIKRGGECNFVDANKFNGSLAPFITKTCQRGIFQGNGKTHEYYPHDNLTKGQILAVLTRILEGKMSDESANPRWIEYYVKMKQIGITNVSNLSLIDLPLTREEMALLLYRFKNLIVKPNGDSNLDQIKNQLSGNNSPVDYDNLIKEAIKEREKSHGNPNTPTDVNTPNTTTGANTNSGLDLDLIAGNTALTTNPEFNEAIHWMYDVGITSFNTTDAYMPFQTLTREQLAKMLDKFAIANNLTTVRNTAPCTFSDVKSDSEFAPSIKNVCQYGIMVGGNGKFTPSQIVNKAEFIAMLIRLVEGKSLEENVSPRRANYYQKAIDLSLISAQDTITFQSPITRYEVAIFLYRLKVRLTMYNNLNDSKLADEIVRTLEETTTTGSSKKTAKIYVDILALNNSAFTDGYVEILGERYKVKKSTSNTYNVGANSFVRYGDLIDFSTDKYIGTLTFIMTNGTLTEGAVRFTTTKQSYYISKDEVTTTYYRLKQV